jgi:two-component system, chemotaxis family, protein-glutamate methylesterase/glutaminase
MSDIGGARPRGVVAFGASAGGIDALQHAVAGLPSALPVAICVVLHIPATSRTVLAQIISRRTRLSVAPAVDGEPLRAGHVHVAAPDRHLIVTRDSVVLDHGPKENGVRPAIDPLFRSVAAACGRRGAAVVLSGALADGSLGAAAVAAAGGTVLVQHPGDAAVPSMPEAALRAVPTARAVPRRDLAGAVVAFATALPPGELEEEVTMPPDNVRPSARSSTRPTGPPSALTCPECNGPLWEQSENGVVHFRCRVGHGYNEDVLVEEKGSAVEAAMWIAVESLEEHAELIRKVAGRMSGAGREHAAAMLRRRATRTDERAEVLRSALAAGDGSGEAQEAHSA